MLQEEIVVAKQESKFMFQLAQMDALKRHLRESQTCRSGFSDTLNWNLRLSPLLLPTSQFPQTHKGISSIATTCVVWGNGDVQSVLLHSWPRDSLLFNYLSDIILASSSSFIWTMGGFILSANLRPVILLKGSNWYSLNVSVGFPSILTRW